MARIINGSVTGPFVLSLSDPLASGGSDDPLIITSTGTIVSTGLDDVIDGAADTAWTIFSKGLISAQYGWDIVLAGAGEIYNSGTITSASFSGGDVKIGSGIVVNQGLISSNAGRVAVQIDGDGEVVNEGTIISGAQFKLSQAIKIDGNGTVINQGTIIGGGDSVAAIAISNGLIENYGSIAGNLYSIQLGGGSIINYGYAAAGRAGCIAIGGASVTNYGTINGNGNGISGAGTVTNFGLIKISVASGVVLEDGTVANFGTISGGSFGVNIRSTTDPVRNSGMISGSRVGIIVGSGEVVNQGTILGGVEIGGEIINQGLISDGLKHPGVSVLFDPTYGNNLLVIKPGAVFDGAAEATSGTNSAIELARGSDAISGIGESQFTGFDILNVDAGANWTLNGANAIGAVLNDGRLDVAGSLDVITAVDPTSTGVFQLDGPSTLEIAAALGTGSKIGFAIGSKLLVDSSGLFGENIGTNSYAGPLLDKFVGSTIDLKDFGVAGLQFIFSKSSGLLQLTNSASQMATLDFKTASLGGGAFHFEGDGGTGVLITHT